MSSQFESMSGKADYPFPEYINPPINPVPLGQKWLCEAMTANVCEPRGMVLSTVDNEMAISSRVIAILKFSDIGIIFATHRGSRKVKNVGETPAGCGHFYWRELSRQLSVSGQIVELDRELALEEWAKRPIPLHSMSTVSHQSEILESYDRLLVAAEKISTGLPLPCPDRYAVYVLKPLAMEFWASSSSRLHRRLRYQKRLNGEWENCRLQP